MITILNTSILTSFGDYEYREVDLETAWLIVRRGEFLSAVGHQATADILTELLGVAIPMNRIAYEQAVGDRALVFKLSGRPREGAVLTREEIDAIGYGFGLLTRIR